MAKILVTGASGLLGSNLVSVLANHHEVVALSHSYQIRQEGIAVSMADLSIPENATQIIGQHEPDWVIHCAAETSIDRCETDPEMAFRLNCDMAQYVAHATQASGGRLMFISTDAVFDGAGSQYQEEEVPQPINVYGQSKLEGERAVSEEDPRALIIRTNFYGWNAVKKQSLAEWFLSHLEMGEICRGFTDVNVKLLLVNDLVDVLMHLIDHECEGIYHVLGKDCVSKYTFGRRLAKIFKLDEQLIQPIEVKQAGLGAPRALNLCLDTSKVSNALGLEMPSLDDGIRRFHELKQTGYPESLKLLIGVQDHEGN